MKSKALREQRQYHYFALIVVFLYIILNTGCHGFKFTSGMFDFEALGHGNGSRLANDTNATQPIE